MKCRYLALLLATSACSAKTGFNAASAPAGPVSRDLFPLHLASFDRGDSTVYDDPNAGISYRYRDPHSGATADVYRYPMMLGSVCTGKCLSDMIDQEMTQFKIDIPVYIQHGSMDSAVVIGMHPALVSETSWLETGRHLELRVFRSGAWNHSDFWLFAGEGVRLKVRATSPESQDPPAYEALIQDLVRLAGAPFICPRGGSNSDAVQISSKQKADPRALARRITGALDSLGYARHYHDPDSGTWSSDPRFEGDAAVGVAVRLGQVGDSLSLIVMSRALCQSAGGGQSGSTLAMTAAFQLTARIAGK